MRRRKRTEIQRSARVRLLAAEVDRHLEAAIRRGARFDAKAVFIVTASGLVAGSSVLRAAASPLAPWAGIPIGFALLGVASAVWAFWARTIDVPDTRKIVNDFVEKPITPDELEDILLEIRTVQVLRREGDSDRQARIVTVGFVMLLLAVTSLLVFVLVAGQFPPEGEPYGTQTPTSAAI
ncbi:hypothetical protein [Curtobacterium sp. VKM Ac-2852]|uniref:hypothetical protein n=1 Tax=Curtobacterium sp. VKM Ac-2852 TaxID=2739024 RepID=UPI0015641F95|nr:hypothetical protein [Curtobacterium sp. VKM Ac-2852]NQX22828.1 hypothetical protein [Curtobacterium sp. VKM Ac-2852]